MVVGWMRLWRRWLETGLQWLISPCPQVTDQHERQQSSLMASLTLGTFVVILFALLVPIQMSEPGTARSIWFATSVAILIILAGTYVLSRRGHYRMGSIVLMLVGSILIFGTSLVTDGILAYNGFFYLIILSLFSTLFLSLRVTSLLFLLHVAGMVVLGVLQHPFGFGDFLSGPISFNLLCFALMILFAYHRRRVEQSRHQAIEESESRYRALTELISDYAFSCTVSPDGTIHYDWATEASLQRVTGYTLQELDSHHTGQIGPMVFHPEEREALREELRQTLAGNATDSEHRIVTKSGEQRWIHIYRKPIWDRQQQRVTRYLGVAQDITQRKQTEIDLRLERDFAHQIMTSMKQGLTVIDANWRFEYLNPYVTEILGYPAGKLIGADPLDLVYPDDREILLDAYRARNQGETTSYEIRLVHQQGHVVPVSIVGIPRWDAGTVNGSITIISDLSERYRSENQLRASEERYRAISELISDYAYALRVEADGTVRHEWITEDSFLRTTGYSHDELDQNGVVGFSLFHPDESAYLDSLFREKTLKGIATATEHRIVRKDGSIRWLHIMRRPVWDEQQGRVVRLLGVANDITDRKLADLALQESEKRYRIISDMISDYAYYLRIMPDGSLKREWMTESVTRMTGYKPEEIFPTSVEMYHEEDRERVIAERNTLIATGVPTVGEYRLITKQGNLRWIRLYRYPDFDDAKQVMGYYAIVQDITSHKEAVEQHLTLVLQQQQSQFIQQFVRALSHDFRTRLATIETNRYLIEHAVSAELGQSLHHRFHTINDSIQQMSHQLENLNVIAMLDSSQFVLADMARIAEDTFNMLKAKAQRADIRMHYEAESNLPPLRVDPDRMAYALRQLVINAIHHTPPQGDIIVRLTSDVRRVFIAVSDSGSGIAPEDLPHIFEPFFRADSARRVQQGGMGLGLTLSKMIVEAHQGRITVESQPDGGSLFIIELPVPVGIALA